MLTYKQLLNPKVIINAAIAGGLVFFGALSSGNIELNTFIFAFCGAGVAFLTQLRDDVFPQGKKGLFNFIQL